MAAPKFQPALLGGLFAGILSALPFVNFANCCCLWVIAGGVIAAYLMQQNYPLPVSAGDGAVVGFLAGIVGAIVAAAVSLPIHLFLGPMLPAFSQGNMWRRHRDMPPEVRDMMRGVSPWVFAVIGGMIFFVIELVFSTLGGLFGALIFRKPTPPAAPPGPPPPPHPPIIPPAGPPVESWSYPDQNTGS
jgi:hypothetical protein